MVSMVTAQVNTDKLILFATIIRLQQFSQVGACLIKPIQVIKDPTSLAGTQ